MKKCRGFFIFILIFMLVATGCGAPGSSGNQQNSVSNSSDSNKSEPANATQNSSSNETTTLSLNVTYPYTDAVIKGFEEKYPNIKIELGTNSLNFENGAVQALLRSGKGPDLMVVGSGPGRVGLLSDSGLILPIEDIVDLYGIEQRYQEWVIEQTRNQGHGKLYELVEGVDVFQVYYNKDIFEEHGIEVPTTWDEFLANCKILQNAGVQPMLGGFRDNYPGGWLLGNLVEAAAGQKLMTDVIYGDGSFDQEEIIMGGQMLKTLVDNKYIDGPTALALGGDQADAAFLNGEGAMIVVPQGKLASQEDVDNIISKFGSFLIPSREEGRPDRPSAGLAHSWVINADIDKGKLDAAGKWLDWVSSEEYLKIAHANGAGLVPTIKVPEGMEIHPIIQDATKKLENGAGYNPSVYLPAKAKDAWYIGMQGITSGSMTPEEAMTGVEEALVIEKAGK